MTYSEIVHLLSSHMVPVDDYNPQQTIPLLEKFVNKIGVDFQELELEMQQRQDSEDISNNLYNHSEGGEMTYDQDNNNAF